MSKTWLALFSLSLTPLCTYVRLLSQLSDGKIRPLENGFRRKLLSYSNGSVSNVNANTSGKFVERDTEYIREFSLASNKRDIIKTSSPTDASRKLQSSFETGAFEDVSFQLPNETADYTGKDYAPGVAILRNGVVTPGGRVFTCLGEVKTGFCMQYKRT